MLKAKSHANSSISKSMMIAIPVNNPRDPPNAEINAFPCVKNLLLLDNFINWQISQKNTNQTHRIFRAPIFLNVPENCILITLKGTLNEFLLHFDTLDKEPLNF